VVAIRPNVVIITGTPGVGKSTVARLLAGELGAELISLGELVEREGLHEGRDPETGSLLVDLSRLAERLSEILAATKPGQLFVVEGHYAQNVVPADRLLMAFVLRKNPYELKCILVSRGYRGRKLYENLQAEILDVCLWETVQAYGMERVYEVDTTSRSPEEIVTEVLKALKARKSRVGVVDWLGVLERDGRLSEFFNIEKQH